MAVNGHHVRQKEETSDTGRLNENGSLLVGYVFGDRQIPGSFLYSSDNLTAITISEDVTNINNGAFTYCENLSSITCERMTAPTLQDLYGGVFGGISATGTLYVPQGSTGYSSWINILGEGWTLVEQ